MSRLTCRRLLAALALAMLAGSVSPGIVLAQDSNISAEAEAWDLIRDSADPAILERFLTRYPDGPHAADARAKLDALADSGGSVLPPASTDFEPASPVVVSSSNVVLEVQQELQRAGCSPGTPDGDWGGRSRAALGRFADATGANVGGEPNARMLAVLQAHPGKVCRAQSTPKEAAPQPKRSSCIVLNVRADQLDYNGEVWDWRINGNPEPDIVITERTTGLSASCPDSFSCRLVVQNPPAELNLRIVDQDNVSRDQVMGEGACSASKGCSFRSAKVSIGSC